MMRERSVVLARRTGALLFILALVAVWAGCGQSSAEPPGGGSPQAGPRGPGGPAGGRGGPGGRAGFPGFGAPGGGSAIPVKVTTVTRRAIADYLETNGSLEAENEVDIVARTSGPIVELNVEEGDFVRAGQVLARIDAVEIEAQLGIARVNLAEAELAWNRAQRSFEEELISQEAYDLARSNYDAAAAQIVGTEILLDFTVIRSPFDGLIIERVVRNAEYVGNNARLFRISDFDPLLCPIQLPEKDLPRLEVGQPAYLTVEAYPQVRFPATVLRINPVIDAATGTVKVTLEVDGQGQLRPGMFASVFVETDVHENALVIPKAALVLESTSDTVYAVVDDGAGGTVAERRELELGYEESESLEVISGVAEGEDIVTTGQDGLSDMTPVLIVERDAPPAAPEMQVTAAREAAPPVSGGAAGQSGADAPPPGEPAAGQGGRDQPSRRGNGRSGPPPGFFEPGSLTPERVEMIRSRMKERGMSDEQIDRALERMRSGQQPPGPPPGGRTGGPPA